MSLLYREVPEERAGTCLGCCFRPEGKSSCTAPSAARGTCRRKDIIYKRRRWPYILIIALTLSLFVAVITYAGEEEPIYTLYYDIEQKHPGNPYWHPCVRIRADNVEVLKHLAVYRGIEDVRIVQYYTIGHDGPVHRTDHYISRGE